jgi:uncharacterized protein YhaN
MSILDEINKERDAALEILDQKLKAANDLRNAGATGMDNTIEELAALEEKLAEQAFTAALDHPTMAQALAALKDATKQMKAVAAEMVSATTFISNVASLGTATNKAASALKGTG